jgi:hypothetical protein
MENQAFNDYVAAFKELSLKQKEDLTIEELISLFSFMNKLRRDVGITKDVLINDEINDMNAENRTHEDFVEAMFVYVCSLKEYFAEYVDKIADVLYVERNDDNGV